MGKKVIKNIAKMKGPKTKKPHKLKRLSLKGMSFQDAVKLFVNTTTDDMKKAAEKDGTE